MVWTPPMTAVNGDAFSAAEYNTHIRDNLLETMPSLARHPALNTVADGGGRRWFVTATKNKIKARAWHNDTASMDLILEPNVYVSVLNSYADIPNGPFVPSDGSVTIRTGGAMLVILDTFIFQAAGTKAFMSFAVYDADNNEVIAPDDNRAISTATGEGTHGLSAYFYVNGLEPEKPYWVSTKYKVDGSLITDVGFAGREITVIEL